MSDLPAMLFVDAQNLFHGSRAFDPDYRYDTDKLKDVLAEDYRLVRAYWYDSFDDLDDKIHFFTMLERSGYRVVKKPLRERGLEKVEKGVDIELATELIAQAYNDAYEVAIVVTGDDDFERAVRYVQNRGKVVHIASFAETIGRDLRALADEYIELDAIADAIER